ncbi:unnamed protein product, partial [Lampetra fluviatilis]
MDDSDPRMQCCALLSRLSAAVGRLLLLLVAAGPNTGLAAWGPGRVGDVLHGMLGHGLRHPQVMASLTNIIATHRHHQRHHSTSSSSLTDIIITDIIVTHRHHHHRHHQHHQHHTGLAAWGPGRVGDVLHGMLGHGLRHPQVMASLTNIIATHRHHQRHHSTSSSSLTDIIITDIIVTHRHHHHRHHQHHQRHTGLAAWGPGRVGDVLHGMLGHGLRLPQGVELQEEELEVVARGSGEVSEELALRWLSQAMRSLALSRLLRPLLLQPHPVASLYAEHAFARSVPHVTAMLLCLGALEENNPGQLAMIDPAT